MKFFVPIVAAILFSAFAQQSLIADNNASQRDIVATAASNGSFNTLVSLLVATGLDDALSADGSFTVFAPNDEAFAKLPSETLTALRKPENTEMLSSILKYHVVAKELSVPKNRPSHPLKSIASLLGPEIRFQRNGSELRVNDSKVIARNIRCTNGVIQVIDAVLMPPKSNTIVDVAAEAGTFNTLLATAKAAGLVDALTGKGPFTVFAPTDEAFAKLPKATIQSLLKPENKEQLATILKYHVVAGNVSASDAVKASAAKTLEGREVRFSIRDGSLNVNDSIVTANDIETSNGVIHVIDTVLMPPTPKKVTIRANYTKSVNRDGIEADILEVYCAGGGNVRLTGIQANKVVTRVSGGGNVTLKGAAGQHIAQVSGGGVLSARDLESGKTQINVNGGGVASVNATEKLKARAAAGAKIRYVKTSAEVEKNINRWAEFVSIH